jgi:hypothetical protein
MLITNHKPYKMKALLLVCLCFLSFSFLNAQERHLKITNEVSSEEVVIKEGKRIRLYRNDGKKISGRFSVVDNNSILIKNYRIAIQDIVLIKKHPLAQTLIGNVILIGGGAAIALISAAGASYVENASPLVLLIPAGGMVYMGITSPNILKAYKKRENWKYEIVIPEKTATPATDLAL